VADNRIDIIVGYGTRELAADNAEIIRLLRSIAGEADKSSRTTRQGLKETRKETKNLIDTFVDLKGALQEIDQFAAQIAGMGRMGAQQRDLAESFDYLAERAGLSGAKLVLAMQQASKGTLSANTIMQASNMVLGAQFESTQEDYAKMVEFARLKSKQFGLSVENAFNRMVFGAVKAEVEFLDELGITLRLNDALKMYAEQLGVATSALTNKQRSQAIWNALLTQAGDQLEEVGGDVELHTDAYDQLAIKLKEATDELYKFIDASGVGPIISTVSQAIGVAIPLLTTYISLKALAATTGDTFSFSLIGQTRSLLAYAKALKVAGGMRAVFAAAAPTLAMGGLVAGGAVVAVKSHEKLRDIQKEIGEETTKTTDKWSAWLSNVEETSSAEESAIDIAGRYADKRQEVADALYEDGNALKDLGMWMARNHIDEEKVINARQEEIEQLVRLKSKSYPEYKAAIQEINDAQTKHAQKIRGLVEVEFLMLQRGLEGTAAKLRIQAELIEERARAVGNMTGIEAQAAMQLRQKADAMDAEAEATKRNNAAKLEEARIMGIIQQGMSGAGVDSETLKAKQDELAIALEQVTAEKVENRKTLEYLATAYTQGLISIEQFKEAIDAAKTGLVELTDAQRKAIENQRRQRELQAGYTDLLSSRANAEKQLARLTGEVANEIYKIERDNARRISDLQENANRDRTKALEDYQKGVADASRNHGMRMADIERNYRKRVADIERQYTKTVAEAAVDRDALAIFRAREARTEQLRDAEEGRSEAIDQENRSYAEQLRGLEESYRARLQNIQQSLDQEIAREREAHVQRINDARQARGQEIAELQSFLAQRESLLAQHVANMRRLWDQMGGVTRRNMPRIDPMTGGGFDMQHGGAGVVTGPATFRVEPGMTEAFWFSGGQRGAPQFGSGMQAASQSVRVGGNVGVNVSGLGDQLGERIAPQIGQLIVDALAEAYSAA
jgi:hypothetical protein